MAAQKKASASTSTPEAPTQAMNPQAEQAPAWIESAKRALFKTVELPEFEVSSLLTACEEQSERVLALIAGVVAVLERGSDGKPINVVAANLLEMAMHEAADIAHVERVRDCLPDGPAASVEG